METDSSALVSDGAAKISKKADKILCFRCGKNGHMADACEAVSCVYCERATHVAKDCHLLKMPKPAAALYGLCRNELMIYEVPVSDELIFKHDSGKLGRIRVDGGILSTEQIF
jgi:late competence protein required for DNA uptake (superfamily II DNA/RNA helicase)